MPGCGCPGCSGIPADHPARQPRRSPDYSEWEGRAERARNVSLLEVCEILGLETQKKGSALYVSCPMHEDKTPSLSLGPKLGRSGFGTALAAKVAAMRLSCSCELGVWVLPML